MTPTLQKNSGSLRQQMIGFAMVAACVLLATPAAHAAVQITGLADRTVAASTGTVGRASENFCVVSTTGAAVSLAFTSTGGAASDGQSWQAKNAAGVAMAYQQYLAYADGSGEALVSRSGSNTFAVAAARTVASAAACGAGNLTKSVVPTNGRSPTGSGAYTDTVTVTATPI